MNINIDKYILNQQIVSKNNILHQRIDTYNSFPWLVLNENVINWQSSDKISYEVVNFYGCIFQRDKDYNISVFKDRWFEEGDLITWCIKHQDAINIIYDKINNILYAYNLPKHIGWKYITNLITYTAEDEKDTSLYLYIYRNKASITDTANAFIFLRLSLKNYSISSMSSNVLTYKYDIYFQEKQGLYNHFYYNVFINPLFNGVGEFHSDDSIIDYIPFYNIVDADFSDYQYSYLPTYYTGFPKQEEYYIKSIQTEPILYIPVILDIGTYDIISYNTTTKETANVINYKQLTDCQGLIRVY